MKAITLSLDNLGPATEGKESQFMSAKYTDEPIGEVKVVPDFLPPPEQLVFREENKQRKSPWPEHLPQDMEPI